MPYLMIVPLPESMQGDVNWGHMFKKEKLENWSEWMGNACFLQVLVLLPSSEYMECMHAYPLPIHCTENPPILSEDFGAMNGQWVRVHALTKGKPKTWHNMHFPFNPINFANFSFLTLLPIYSPCTRPSETILTNKALIVKVQINRLSQGYLTWWIKIAW